MQRDSFAMEELSKTEFLIGSRCQVKANGSPRLQGRMGTVVGWTQTKNGIRIVFDGSKSPQTLHRSYLELIAATDSVES